MIKNDTAGWHDNGKTHYKKSKYTNILKNTADKKYTRHKSLRNSFKNKILCYNTIATGDKQVWVMELRSESIN